MSDEFDFNDEEFSFETEQVRPSPKPSLAPPQEDDSGEDYMGELGMSMERTVPDITKPWMKHHKFVLVKTVQELNDIVDAAIAAKKCALDLESQGLDTRIFYHEDGKPFTKHQIVGFCLSYDGVTGYYVPIRHDPEDGSAQHLNLPIRETEEAITRLCLAAQPKVSEKALEGDPLSAKKEFGWDEDPKLVIYFWNAKFDQELLYPITGIDWWHPESFEDGNLAYFCYYSGDKQLSLKDKALQELKDIEGNPYEMIKLKELFVQGRKDIEFEKLSPDEPGCVKYACSDAICTFLLCEPPRAHEKDRKPIMRIVREKYNSTYRIEKQTAQTGRWMERPRVRVNRDKAQAMLESNQIKLDEVAKKIQNIASAKGVALDIASSKQLSDFLFTDRGLNITMPVNNQDWPEGKPQINEKSGQYKTDANTLEQMVQEHPSPPEILKLIVEWRELEKLKGTYLENLVNNIDPRGEMRFQFKQTGAQTGRYSAPAGDPAHGYSGIPIHGIPGTSALRKCFEAREGYSFVKMDYAAQELRVAANVSGEDVWVKEFLEGTGDLHTITARAFFGKHNVSKEERKVGKCVHPDTLAIIDGKLTSMRSLSYPDKEDTFQSADHTIFDGVGTKKITATYNGGVKEQFHVVLTGGLVTCTPQHQFRLRDGTWVKAGDLQPGMLLEETKLPPIEDRPYQNLNISLWEGIPTSNYTLNHDLAYFAGLYVGDGTGNESSISLTHGEANKIDDYGYPYSNWIEILEKATEQCGLVCSRKDHATIYLGSRVLSRFLEHLGIQTKSSRNLRIPTWVLEAGPQAITYYLAGLFDTDGTVSPKGVLEWTTKDFVLGGQVSMALRACGLDFNSELTFNKTYQRYYVRLRLTVASSNHFKPFMRHRGKVERLRVPIYEGREVDRFVVRKVLPVERVPRFGASKDEIEEPNEFPCVDISVEDSHVYVANGFVTHNTSNFALLYGGGPAAIMRASGCDKVEATRRKQAFDKSVPIFAKWVKEQHKKVKVDNGVWNCLGRWIAIPPPKPGTAPEEIRKQEAGRERAALNYQIQSVGADAMKISLILLCKEFYKRGWLKQNGGDDSLRMLLTVHDEIVYEIRNERVQEAIAIIRPIMESPWRMAKPAWRVPLIVEALIGLNWAGEYDYGMLTHGKPFNPEDKFNEELEIKIGDRVYHKVPPWLGDMFKPGYSLDGQELEESQQPTAVHASPTRIPVPSVAIAADTMTGPVNVPITGPVIQIRIGILNGRTVRQVRTACASASDPDNGSLLCLVDPTGKELISPSRGIRVIPEKFVQSLLELNLTDGNIYPYVGNVGKTN